MPRRSGDDDVDNSPSSEASEQPDLPSPRVGEDFHLHRRHFKSWENMAFVKGSRRYHARGPNGPGWSDPVRWSCHLGYFGPRGLPRLILVPTILIVIKKTYAIFS
jgi:hypothetical protein